MNSDDLLRLADKFCAQCELTAVESENAVTYQMFLSRFLAFVKKEEQLAQMAAPTGNILQFDSRRETTSARNSNHGNR